MCVRQISARDPREAQAWRTARRPSGSIEVSQTMCSKSFHSDLLTYSNEDIAGVVTYLDERRVGPTQVVTHHLAQENVLEAFNTVIEKKDEAIKVVVDVH